ncbi:unnamed protein product [Rotaria magnacalcarata]|nr:unnamed protein product [Rotaria magnacalcarata]
MEQNAKFTEERFQLVNQRLDKEECADEEEEFSEEYDEFDFEEPEQPQFLLRQDPVLIPTQAPKQSSQLLLSSMDKKNKTSYCNKDRLVDEALPQLEVSEKVIDLVNEGFEAARINF